ncbi:hypothetical protein EZS27_016513, partial [termite gut metagenome]
MKNVEIKEMTTADLAERVEVETNNYKQLAINHTIPPCGCVALGFVLLDTILIPSTIARFSFTKTFNTRPVFPLST